MDKKEIFEKIKSILNDNKISVYRLAQITNINRTTMQKAFSGDRNLSLRQFRDVLNALPVPLLERENLYNDFYQSMWSQEQIKRNQLVLEILNSISNSLDIKSEPMGIECKSDLYNSSGVYSKEDFYTIMEYTIANSKNTQIEAYSYVPFHDNFFYKAISKHINDYSINCNINVLFEFLNHSSRGTEKNLVTLKNITPLITDSDKRYKLHYVYVDSYFYDNHLSVYPYYIVFNGIVILVEKNLNHVMIVNDSKFAEKIISAHKEKLEYTNVFNSAVFDFTQAILKLIQDEPANTNAMYSITEEPCLSAFVPLEMYHRLITNDFPEKAYISELISHRLDVISKVAKKYVLFNKDAIYKFAENGNLFLYCYKYLNPCTIEERITVLKNFLNSIDDKYIVARAFDSNKINVTNNYEITEIKDSYNFSLFIYTRDNKIKLVQISEPTISSSLIEFIHDIIETKYTYSFEETRQIVKDAIESLEKSL